ncbi:S8 family serine peptidase [Actinacidiphila acididurans]|uniref:S8 family serine peptidase n=1 Tax=Actinacidiphila acididurans TaxID=2784346 RepID=UPI001F2FFF53|nr:S8 family serine peptidase [Actinacidiphila acididurans]
MRSPRKRWTLTTAATASLALLLTPLAVAGPASAAYGATPGQSPSAASQADGPAEHTVTLVTGDVVTVRQKAGTADAGGTVSVKGPDGGPARARILESAGDLYVFPDSAMPYVADGELDRRLFDVTNLIADGYDNAHRDSLPLIISYGKQAPGFRATPAPKGSSMVRTLASVGGAAVTADHAQVKDFWSAVTGASSSPSASSSESSSESSSAPSVAPGATTPSFKEGIKHIWLDGTVHADLAESTAQIGAPQAWATGDTGQGVDVAVLDTGVDTSHPDLAGRIVDTRSFIAGEDVKDHNGHGTHVASTIAGTGAASGGTEKGVAPGARLHIGKVLSNEGQGSDSEVLAGMQWAAVDEHAKVINMSLGDPDPSDGTDPLSQAVNQLSAQTGALFVIAAGNSGDSGTVGSPGAADAALTVGAVDSNDSLAYFSSQGPRVGDGALKPEITAPGVDILAARSQYAAEGEGYYQTLSGTSMATPHVTGAAALVAAEHPELTGAQLKDLLTSTSKQTPAYNSFEAGSGRVDAAAATRAAVFATATAYAGESESGPVQRPVTYTNLGDSTVTLALSISAPGAPAGTFRLSADSVTVPAHGTAGITLTIDPTAAASASGSFSGQILASGPDGVLAHTAISLGAVSHKMTINVKDAAGNPGAATVALLRAGDPTPALIPVEGSATFYTPDDNYSALGFMTVPGAHGPRSQGMALLGDPDIAFNQDRTVTLDAGHIRRVDETIPQPGDPTYLRLEYNRALGQSQWLDFEVEDTAYDSLWVQPQGAVKHGDFYLGTRWRKEQPALTVSARGVDYTDVLRQDNVTPLPAGTRTFPLAFAGNGAAADYDGIDVHGKAVVVRRTATVTPVAQAKAAADAGAALLLVANDRAGRQQLSFGTDGLDPTTIDVGLLSPDEGDKLIAQAQQSGVVLRAQSHPVATYVYDLMHTWHNELPKNMVVQASQNNLVRIDENFDSPAPSPYAQEWRYDYPVYSEWGIGQDVALSVNSRRTDWVSTDGANTWGQEASDGTQYENSVQRSYHPGAVVSEDWFKPVQRPYLNNSYLGPTRTGNQMRIDVPGYGNADHAGYSLAWGTHAAQSVTLYQGDTRLGSTSSGLVMSPNLPGAAPLPYRLVVANQRDASYSPYSSSTTTQWKFTSAAPTVSGRRDLLPLLQIGLDVRTDDAGFVSRDSTFGVTVQQRAPVAVGLVDVTVAGAGTPGAPRVEVSYDDGTTWTPLTVDAHGHYRFNAPRAAAFASLRLSASDSAGNTVDQTIIRAVGLR